MDGRTHLRNVAKDMIREAGLTHVSVHAVLGSSDEDPVAPRSSDDLVVVLLGWSPSFHPMRIPVRVRAIHKSKDGTTSHSLEKLRKAIRSQAYRQSQAVAIFGPNPKPRARALDVPIVDARPDVSHMMVMPYLFEHLAAVEGSNEVAMRRIEFGVETMLRRRELGITSGRIPYVMQNERYDEERELASGLHSKYGVLVSSTDHLPVVGDPTGRRLGEFFDVPGLNDHVIESRNGHFRERYLRIAPKMHEWTRIRDLLPREVESMGPQVVERPSPTFWTRPSESVARAMRNGRIEDVTGIATMTDDELAENCGANETTIVEMRRHAASTLSEMLAMNAGRLVRRF